MSDRSARKWTIRECILIADQERLDRPEKPRGSSRRRCGDVIRWKENNQTIDEIQAALRLLLKDTA